MLQVISFTFGGVTSAIMKTGSNPVM